MAVQAQRLHVKPTLPGVRVVNVRQRVLDDEDVAAILAELPEDIRAAP